MFRLTDAPIETLPFESESAGGFVSFEGKVRDHAQGRKVLSLEYEAFSEMAQTEGDKLVSEAIAEFGLTYASIVHRTGLLQVGETAVVIQVAAAHRREAFVGCEWLIDQLKWRVPIWKREHFVDGQSEWVGIGHDKPDQPSSNEFVRRQMKLPFIGEAGQQKLANARVLLVGVGGLGCGSLPYLVGSGIGTVGIVDGDVVELSNLHRQILYTPAEAGRGKAERAAAFAKRLNPNIVVHVFPQRLSDLNGERILADYDWIVDGTDSLETKFLLNALCKRLGKTLVTASVHRMEGQVLMVTPDGPCLQCLFPETPSDGCVGTCAEDGILGAVTGAIGIYQATEVLKGILGLDGQLSHSMLLVDIQTGTTTTLMRRKREQCPGCEGVIPNLVGDFQVGSISEAGQRLGRYDLIDIRERDELPEISHPHTRLPLSELGDIGNLAFEGPTLFVCASGARSQQLAVTLRNRGNTNVFSLRGGIAGL